MRTNRCPAVSSPRASFAAATSALMLFAGAAHASDWRWNVTPYAWATDVGVDTKVDGREIVDETIPVSDLLDDIDVTFQGRIEAHKGMYGAMFDVFYVGMSDDVTGLALPQNAGSADLHWKMDMTIVDVAGTYDPAGDGAGLTFLYGARILDQRATLDADFTTPGGPSVEPYETSDTIIDALAGIGFSKRLTRHLGCRMQSDVSTGGTDVTWSTFPSLTWALGGGRHALTAGYRHMNINFKNEGGLDSEITLTGPVLGVRTSF